MSGSDLDAVWSAWTPGDPHFDGAVQDTVATHGYARADVERQLTLVAQRCSGAHLAEMLDRERSGSACELPRRVGHLVSGNVPGLGIESAAHTLWAGCTTIVVPSRTDTTVARWSACVQAHAPELARRLQLVDVAPWSELDAAIVYGSDATVAVVRARMPNGLVVGYGSRVGVAVATTTAITDPTMLELLADDVATFRQRGCMSPSELWIIGEPEISDAAVTQVEGALMQASGRHRSTDRATRAPERRDIDAGVLAAMSASPEQRTIVCGELRLTIHAAVDEDALARGLHARRAHLQTAVVVAGESEQPFVETVSAQLVSAGCSRVCEPGAAHEPEWSWRHDGIGRFAPLCAR